MERGGGVAEVDVGVEFVDEGVAEVECAVPVEAVAGGGEGVDGRRGAHLEEETVETVAASLRVDVVDHVMTGLVVGMVEEGVGLIVADRGEEGVEDSGGEERADLEMEVETAVASGGGETDMVIVGDCGAGEEEGVGILEGELRGAEVDGVEMGVGGKDVEEMGDHVGAAVGVGGGDCVEAVPGDAVVGREWQELVGGGLLPEGVGGGSVEEPEGVEDAITDEIGAGDKGMGGEVDSDGEDKGVGTKAATDAGDEGDGIGTRLRVGGVAVVRVGGETIAEVPPGCFGHFVGGDRIDTVGGDGGTVEELDVDAAVGVGNDGVDASKGIARAAESGEGK